MIKSILSLLKEEDKTVSRMNALEDTFINHREREINYYGGKVEGLEEIVEESQNLISNLHFVDDGFYEILSDEKQRLEKARSEYRDWLNAESYTDLAEYKELAEKRKILKKAIRKKLFD